MLLPASARGPAQSTREQSVAAEDEPLLTRQDLALLEGLSLESLDAVLAGFAGQRETPGLAVGFEFADYRRYNHGDDVRRIDWNIYGRLHELYVRSAPQEASLRLSVLIDASRSMQSGPHDKLRYARRLAALLGAVALLRGDGAQVSTLFDGRSGVGAGFDSSGDALSAMLDELERLPAGRTTDLRDSLRQARASGWQQPELAVLVTDGLIGAQDLEPVVGELAASARSATLVQVCEAQQAADWTGSNTLVDSETGARLDVVITPETGERYAQRYAQWSKTIEQTCRRRGLGYVKAETSVDPLALLLDLARRRSLVQAAAGA